MKKNILAAILSLSMIPIAGVMQASAAEPLTPEILFEEDFTGEDGQDLAVAACNQADSIYFKSGFKLTDAVNLDSTRTGRLAIAKQTFSDGVISNTIKRIEGTQPMSTAQAPFKLFQDDKQISMNPTEKNIYYIKWREYIPSQNNGAGGFAEITDDNDFNACMLDLKNRSGAGFCRKDGKLRAFVSTTTSVAATYDPADIQENTWYEMVFRLEANPAGENDSMSLKVYPVGTEPDGDYGAVMEYQSTTVYDRVRYYFKAAECIENKPSDMALSAAKGEKFAGDAAVSVKDAEAAVLELEKSPTPRNLETAKNAVRKISAESIIYGLLSSRIAAAEENVREDAVLKHVSIQGKTDVAGASLYAACTYENPLIADTSFQWYRNGAEIPNAAGQIYTTVSEDIGCNLTVKATDKETVITSEAAAITDDGIVLADETALEADVRLADFNKGFATGWRQVGSDQKISSSKELVNAPKTAGSMIQFDCTGKQYVRQLAAPIDTNSDSVYYITWTQKTLPIAVTTADVLQKFELGGSEETASQLVFGAYYGKGGSVRRSTGLYKRGTNAVQKPKPYLYPEEQYRGVVRIDASSKENGDAVSYKHFRENSLIPEPAAWTYTESGITLAPEKLDKILVQSSYAKENNFGGLKVERYTKDTITAIETAISENPETAKALIAALPDGLAKNDLTAKLNHVTNKGVALSADKAKLESEGETSVQITAANCDDIYYKTAKMVTAEYEENGTLIRVRFDDVRPMQYQAVTKNITVSADADKVKVMLFETMESLRPLGKSIELTK